MKKSFALVAVLVGCGLIVQAGESLKSGPQVGEVARPKPFLPLNINGPTPNQKECLVCRNGNNPVAMIFAREPSEHADEPDREARRGDRQECRQEDGQLRGFLQ